MRNDMDIVEEN